MKQLDDTVSLDGSNATAEQIRDILVDGANIAWHLGGNDGQMTVYANFVALLIQEHDRMKAQRNHCLAALAEIVRDGNVESFAFGVAETALRQMGAKANEVSP